MESIQFLLGIVGLQWRKIEFPFFIVANNKQHGLIA
jgi:hypothetical protein